MEKTQNKTRKNKIKSMSNNRKSVIGLLLIGTLFLSYGSSISNSYAQNGPTKEIRTEEIMHYRGFTSTDQIAAGGLITMIGGMVFGNAELAAMGMDAFKNNLVKVLTLGQRITDVVNPGYQFPDGCIIDKVEIELLNKAREVLQTGPNTKQQVTPFTSFGAYITESYPGTSNGEVHVNTWYDMGTAVRYQVVYSVIGDTCP